MVQHRGPCPGGKRIDPPPDHLYTGHVNFVFFQNAPRPSDRSVWNQTPGGAVQVWLWGDFRVKRLNVNRARRDAIVFYGDHLM